MSEYQLVPLTTKGLLSYRPKKVFPSKAPVTSLEYSADGLRLLTAAENGWLTLYDLHQATSIRVIGCTSYGVGIAVFGAHPEIVLHTSTKQDNNIRYLSMYDNKYIRVFSGHTDKVTNIEFSPTKDTFISCSKDKTLRIWDVRDNKCTYELKVGFAPVAAHDPEGVVVAIGVSSSVIKLYDIRNFGGGPFNNFSITNSDYVFWSQLKFSRSGTNIIISTNSKHFYVLDSFNADYIHDFKTSENRSDIDLFGDVSADDLYGFYGGTDGKLHVFDTKVGVEIGVIKSNHNGPLTHTLFNPFYAMLTTAGTDGVQLWS
uniref:Uncharacterized protein n=1 Tax=Panagrolaimus sp. JU765 TaxID=591449 RepID=A0AC34QVT8_9BILA